MTAVVAELPTGAQALALFQIPATAENFVVKERFSTVNPSLNLVDVDRSFIDFFGGLVEGPQVLSSAYTRLLPRRMRDGNILSRMAGGESKAFLSMYAVYYLLEQELIQGAGFLVDDGKANIFYVYDQEKVPRALSFHVINRNPRHGLRLRVNPVVNADAYRSRFDYWEAGCRVYAAAPLHF